MSSEKIYSSQELGEAIVAARQGERDRIRAITSLPEASGREAAALAIATTTGATVDEARVRLKDAAVSSESMSASWDHAFARRGFGRS